MLPGKNERGKGKRAHDHTWKTILCKVPFDCNYSETKVQRPAKDEKKKVLGGDHY